MQICQPLTLSPTVWTGSRSCGGLVVPRGFAVRDAHGPTALLLSRQVKHRRGRNSTVNSCDRPVTTCLRIPYGKIHVRTVRFNHTVRCTQSVRYGSPFGTVSPIRYGVRGCLAEPVRPEPSNPRCPPPPPPTRPLTYSLVALPQGEALREDQEG